MLLLPGAALGIKQAFSAYPPSSFEYPGTFEHVCVQRGLPPDDDVQVIFASPPADTETPAQEVRGQRGQRSNNPPLEVSLEHALRSGSMLRSRHVATVKVLQSRSVYASINHILQNASMTDVRILGGTAFMMRTPCENMADNYYNALTEEGPLLSRVLEAWRAAEGYVAFVESAGSGQLALQRHSSAQIMPRNLRHTPRAISTGRPYQPYLLDICRHDESEQRTLLLTNRCRHKLYRDDLRDLLLGRHHAVQKLLPGSLVCTNRLVLEASPPPRQLQEPEP